MVTRLVGFLEYGQALQNFDALLPMLTEYELAAVDEIVVERDEFAVYTNLSRSVQRAASSLAETSPQSGSDRFERRGLDWVMALARVELGAMLAGFTNVPSPFEAVRPTEFEFLPYKELLQDGARTHFWALANDPDLRKVSRLSPRNTEVLSYSRRSVIARALTRAAIKAGMGDYSPVQQRELASRLKYVDSLQKGFGAKIELYLRGAEATSSSTKTTTSAFVNACRALLRAEKRERAAGTANIINYGR